ncbi:hypothetical protein QFZ79_001519 [Arthrobacter sp. V4I6]|uniref:DUF2905 domain-containing protein n=1 Tax=Arthrobacter sp. V4I6 TaxID=3042281 RepID=UPI00277F24C5|nr:DUF2905 domain-containing protein [Arthrobacter sp. V4I6]MDQ0853408.1 hypothetical protein [Arthrobacter sp. V4I6]
MGRDFGPLLVAVGLLVVLAGVLAWNGWLSWFGHLPGDVRIDRENVRVYIPWVLHDRGFGCSQHRDFPVPPLTPVLHLPALPGPARQAADSPGIFASSSKSKPAWLIMI